MVIPAKKPPRFVPTLTEVVHYHPPAPAIAPPPAPLPQDIEEALVHRIMQRVDTQLEQHLRAAIAAVVHEQTRSMVPRLREEVESVVRQCVYEAVAQELGVDV